MDVSCDLEVDVNGEEMFIVDKKIISLYSGRICKLFCKSKCQDKGLKVIFNDFPGGAFNFELMTRFCYSNGKINLNPMNVSVLNCIAHYMEMDISVSGMRNLLEETDKLLEGIKYWTWPELLLAVKQCQDLQPIGISTKLQEKYFDSISKRIVSSYESSPCPFYSSPDSSRHRFSFETKSTDSFKNNYFRATWWYEDFIGFDSTLIEILMKSMLSKNIDHGIISRFLFYYHKSRLPIASLNERFKLTKVVVETLSFLDLNLVSYKSLFGLLRVCLNKSISECCRNELENMIGSNLDQATLDDLLVPSPIGTKYLYDVNLILRFMKIFNSKDPCLLPSTRLRKVANLMDLYIVEVAPDPLLKPSKFLGLIKALPDSARVSYDGIYLAIDIYLEVHSGLPEEEKTRVCTGLNYEKLSSESHNHLSRNTKFPSEVAVQALISHQSKLKNLVQDNNQTSPFVDSPCNSIMGKNYEGCEQIVIYAQKLENEKIKAHIVQGVQCRVVELEKACKKIQIQRAKMVKSKLSSQRNARSLPRFCS